MIYTEVKYMPERSRIYLGSPALVRLPDGAIIACHDHFYDEPEAFRGSHPRLTSIYRSEDDGRSFQHISNIIGAFWSTLFLHRGALYLLGCDRCYGSIVIRRSDDGGFTWSWPVNETSGLLFRGGEGMTPPNYHCAPVPVTFHNGRIYRAFEDNVTGHWPTGFQALVISAPEDADLLAASSWRMSNKLPFDAEKVPADWGDHGPGFLEGNVVAGPDGTLWDVMVYRGKESGTVPALDLNLSPIKEEERAGEALFRQVDGNTFRGWAVPVKVSGKGQESMPVVFFSNLYQGKPEFPAWLKKLKVANNLELD